MFTTTRRGARRTARIGAAALALAACIGLAPTQASAGQASPRPAARTWSNVADGFAQGTTGGAAGQTVTVSTLADLKTYAAASAPYTIRVNGQITVTPYGYEIPIASNKTVIGVGTSGEIVNGGLHLNPGTSNVIIRNLTIRDTKMADDDPDDKTYDYDGIQMDTSDHIWIDHNRIERMNDGLIDSRLDTTYLTVSWNIMGGNNKAFGIGWTDNVTARMTIHHNWIHDTNQRNPSVDNVALAHLYNNYLTNITSYGNLSRGSTKLVLENSYFDNVKNPYYNDTSAAQLRQSGSIVVNSSGKVQTNGSAFTPSSYYAYTLDAAADVPALLKTYAGPQANIGVESGSTLAGTYAIASGASGKCLTVAGSSTSSGALLVQAACSGASIQQWKLVASGGKYNIVNVASGLCVDLPGASTTSGTQLQQWGCGAAQANQLWSIGASTAASGKYLITSASSGQCVSDKDGSTAGNNPIVQEACADVARMQWRLDAATAAAEGGVLSAASIGDPIFVADTPASGGTYAVASGASGKCLEAAGSSTSSGALLVQVACSGAASQQWKLAASGGKYNIVNMASGLCVDLPGASTTSGTQLQQWGCGAAQANQLWSIGASAAASGKYLITGASSGQCVSDKDGSTAGNNPIVQEACADVARMQWRFDAVGGTTPTSTPSASAPTVAADGSGTYRTVQAAIDAVPANNTKAATITIKAGTYREIVTIPANKPYITLKGLGSSASQTVIVNNHSATDYGTSGSATVFAYAPNLTVTNLTISNDYGVGSQAVAAHLNGDRQIFSNVRFLGNQDTLLVNDSTRAYVVNSYIEGTVDFIFGGGTAVFSGCQIYQKRSTGGPITAASTADTKTYGFLFYKVTITGATNNTTQLGRPWRPAGQVLYRESSLSATIATAQPWIDMSGNSWKNARFFEYKNTGAGATTNSNRPQMSDAQAASYTPQKYLSGSDGWNPF